MTVTILTGDARDMLASLSAGTARCCVTSPPYFGLRDYGVDGQIGLEQSPDDYVAALVSVFREVRRVMADDGTLWLNLGDTTKAKNLLMIPARVALALQADGWYLRSHIIWHKPNPMPESVRDRPTNCHESVFLLTKSARYFYDADAVREPAGAFKASGIQRQTEDFRNAAGDVHRGLHHRTPNSVRNLRNVWTITPKPFKGAHFATFPPELAERCIKAGSAVGDKVLDPFFGAGTTGLVADRISRHCIGIELNPEYAELARQRIDAEIITKRTENGYVSESGQPLRCDDPVNQGASRRKSRRKPSGDEGLQGSLL